MNAFSGALSVLNVRRMHFFKSRLRHLLAAVLVMLCVAAVVLLRSKVDEGLTYRVGVDDLRPYQFFSPDGSADGFAVQVLTEAARRSGIWLQFVHAPEGADAALKAGKVDLWPRLRDTPERRK